MRVRFYSVVLQSLFGFRAPNRGRGRPEVARAHANRRMGVRSRGCNHSMLSLCAYRGNVDTVGAPLPSPPLAFALGLVGLTGGEKRPSKRREAAGWHREERSRARGKEGGCRRRDVARAVLEQGQGAL